MRGIAGMGKLAALALAVGLLGACTAQYRSHGYMPPEDQLQQIVPGVDTKASVEDLVGVPNASGVLDNSGYYYIETDVRHFAWQRPKVISREIVAITFDEAGVVDNIATYGLEDGRVVTLNRRVTQSADSNIGFIRKLFGNIGGLDLGGLVGN